MLTHSSETPRPKTGKSGFSKMYICLHKCTRTILQCRWDLPRNSAVLRPFEVFQSETPKVKTHSSPSAKGSRCSKFVKGGPSVDLGFDFFLESTPLTNFPQLAKRRLIGNEWKVMILSHCLPKALSIYLCITCPDKDQPWEITSKYQ